jgi:hypothetical protein
MKSISKIIIFSLTLVIALYYAIFSFYNHFKIQPLYNKQCTAEVTIRDLQSRTVTSLNIFLYIRKGSTGYLNIDGQVFSNGNSYIISRNYNFFYKLTNDDIYHLSNMKVARRDYDNIPDDLMVRIINSKDRSDNRYMVAIPFEDKYLISNPYSPIFICEIK